MPSQTEEKIQALEHRMNKFENELVEITTRQEGCMEIQKERHETIDKRLNGLQKTMYAIFIAVIITLGTIVGAFIKEM